jgi:hypothetical protein
VVGATELLDTMPSVSPEETSARSKTATHPAQPDYQAVTRREITIGRKRGKRRRSLALIAVVAVGAVTGTGFLVQSNLTSNQNVAATEQLAQGTGLQHDQLGVYQQIAAAQAHKVAETTLAAANDVIVAVRDRVDVTPLVTAVASLQNYQSLDSDTVISLAKQTDSETAVAQSAAAEVDRVAAEQAAAEAAAQATALATANTPDGAKATARDLAANVYGWGDGEFSCLVSLWQKESGWNYQALNSSSGATGIPQALPGSKMASVGSDWQTNATTQITWGLQYIKAGYGSPCSAWSHSQSTNWY